MLANSKKSPLVEFLIGCVKKHLSPDLLKKGYGPKAHCYVASEAFYHLWGKNSGCKVYRRRLRGVTHWWLVDAYDYVIDITEDQFKFKIDYSKGVRTGFLTKEPSKRARILMNRITNEQ